MNSTSFASHRQMAQSVDALGQSVSREDAAASVQKFLEDLMLESIGVYLQRTKARSIALAGGVFANVALNRRIAELPGIKEVFIFPGMGDEGLPIGGLYDFLLHRDGIEKWARQRRQLTDVHWGGNHDEEAHRLFSESARRISGEAPPADIAADLLAAGKIVALYHGRMEFGPRALGGRSILATPADATINQTLNDRLQRTEFMPFAPVVLEEDAEDIFAVTPANRYAMRFMTITCPVRDQWRDRIPAVVHVDGSARPQIINEETHPLYAATLRWFKQKTGIPVLINTSFNAHEEPIVYKPAECLRALNDGRIDYLLLSGGVYQKK